MSRRSIIVVALVAACGAAVAGTWVGRWSSSHSASRIAAPTTSESALVVDPTRLHFGDIWETDRFEWTVPVRNRSASPVRVTGSASSCSCVAATSSTPIAPGETVNVTFRIDLRNPCASTVPQAVRDVAITVYLACDSTSTVPLTEVKLRGRVRSAVAISAKSIDLGRLPTTTEPKVREVSVRALMGLRDLTVTVEGGSARAEVKSAGADTWVVQVSPAPRLPPGKYLSTIKLQPFPASGDVVSGISIPIEFDVLGDVQPDSAVLALGPHPVGSTAEGQITLRSLSGRSLAVERWTVAPTGDVEVTAAESDVTSDVTSKSFTVRQKVSGRGNQGARIRFIGADADRRLFEVAVDVVYYGLGVPE